MLHLLSKGRGRYRSLRLAIRLGRSNVTLGDGLECSITGGPKWQTGKDVEERHRARKQSRHSYRQTQERTPKQLTFQLLTSKVDQARKVKRLNKAFLTERLETTPHFRANRCENSDGAANKAQGPYLFSSFQIVT
jgi:hypothetical protein